MDEVGVTNLRPAVNRPKERVAIALQLEVSGVDLDGRDFLDHAWTKIISRGGAAIVIDRPLAPHQTLIIKRVGSDHEAEVRVIGHLGSDPAGGDIYGIALIDTATIWGIAFPAEEIAEPLVKVLLECPGCHTRQMVPLNELELAVFEAKEHLTRSCPKCRDVTFWRQALYGVPPDPPTATTSPPERLPSAQSESARSPTKPPNRRKNRRVKIGLKGCILFYGQETPIEVTDMSRSGILFCCRRSFTDGLLVRVAIPYSPGAANIFVSGRICRCRALPSGMSECGLEYVKD